MFLLLGTRDLGVIDATADTRVTTRFVTAFFVAPLWPLGASTVIDRTQQWSIPLSWRSVAAAYLRAYALPLGFWSVASWGKLIWEYPARFPGPWALAVVGVAVFAFAMLRLGRLTKTELAKRAVFAEVTGSELDPRLLPDDDLAASLRAELATEAARRAGTYRAAPVSDDTIVEAIVAAGDRTLLARALVWVRVAGLDAAERTLWVRWQHA